MCRLHRNFIRSNAKWNTYVKQTKWDILVLNLHLSRAWFLTYMTVAYMTVAILPSSPKQWNVRVISHISIFHQKCNICGVVLHRPQDPRIFPPPAAQTSLTATKSQAIRDSYGHVISKCWLHGQRLTPSKWPCGYAKVVTASRDATLPASGQDIERGMTNSFLCKYSKVLIWNQTFVYNGIGIGISWGQSQHISRDGTFII